MTRPQTPPAWRRWIVLAAVACLLGQTSSLAHLILVRHATCAEHDALVHAPEVTTAAEPSASLGRVQVTASGLPTDRQHEDDHCLAVTLGRKDQLLGAADQGVVMAAVVTGPLPVFAAHTVPAPLPLLLLAPKSSPPAVA